MSSLGPEVSTRLAQGLGGSTTLRNKVVEPGESGEASKVVEPGERQRARVETQ